MNDAEASGSVGRDERTPLQVGSGAQLAAYREERGWTIEQVASQLNLAPRQVVALEHDDHAALPGMPIVRGFIRAYAKLLKVDPVPLLAPLGPDNMHVQNSIEPRHSLSTPFAEARVPSMAGRAGLPLRWLIGAVLVVLLGVGIWAVQQDNGLAGLPQSASSRLRDGIAYLSRSENEAPPAVSVQAPAKASDAPSEPPSEPQVSVTEPVAPELPAPASVAPPPATASVVPAAPAVPPSAPIVAAAPADLQVQSAAPAAPAGKDSLVFNVRKDSWIEVRRTGNNSVLLSQLVKAGSTETVEVSEPVTVVIGNAAGVDASLRGAALDLKVGVGNVARLNVK